MADIDETYQERRDRTEKERQVAKLEYQANETVSKPVSQTDPSRIISPVDQAALGMTPKQDPPSVLLLRIEHKVAGRPAAVMIENAGAQTFTFQQGTTQEQVIALLGSVTEWCKSVVGMEVEFSVKDPQ